MTTYIVRDTKVIAHAHPLSGMRYHGVPVSVHIDGKTHQIRVGRVTFEENPIKIEKTVTFPKATVEYDHEENTANITRTQ